MASWKIGPAHASGEAVAASPRRIFPEVDHLSLAKRRGAGNCRSARKIVPYNGRLFRRKLHPFIRQQLCSEKRKAIAAIARRILSPILHTVVFNSWGINRERFFFAMSNITYVMGFIIRQ